MWVVCGALSGWNLTHKCTFLSPYFTGKNAFALRKYLKIKNATFFTSEIPKWMIWLWTLHQYRCNFFLEWTNPLKAKTANIMSFFILGPRLKLQATSFHFKKCILWTMTSNLNSENWPYILVQLFKIVSSQRICMNAILAKVVRLRSVMERLPQRRVSLQQVLTCCPPLR